jgi:mRNA-degrading endonuclease YafQ of YafQ-DinJ toxin-antitoxin module
MRIFYSPRFLRSFKKLPYSIQDEYRRKELIFRRDPFDSRLQTHKLKARNALSFIITYKIRAIFVFENSDILLVNIGGHSIYRR